jgi:hypothetical protein
MHTTLQCVRALDLGGNDIGADGTVALAAALATKRGALRYFI